MNRVSYCVTMNFKKLLTLLAFCAFITSSIAVEAENQECADHRQLIESSEAELRKANPCDLIGATYMAGFGISAGDPSILGRKGDISIYPYYGLFRSYLAAQLEQEKYSSEEILGFLILGLSVAPEISSSSANSDLRGNYYAAFAISEYWRKNLENSTELPLLFEDALIGWMREGLFTNVHQLRCFIQHDIPTLAVEEITSSERFHICAGGS